MENEIIEKNKEYIVDIIDNGYEGEGIAKINDFTVFVPTAIKGEKCKILIVKVHTTYAYGKILEIIEGSEKRVEPDCSTYKRCGGCNLRHIEYQYTLKMKQQTVQNLISKSTKTPIRVNETIGMVQPYYYRNKLQYPVGLDKNKEIVMGVFAKRTHEIIPVSKCMIQNEKAEEIAKYIFELVKQYNIPPYNEENQTGKIRHIVIKIGIRTNEVMCVVVTNEKKIEREDELVNNIINKFPEVKTVIKNINNKNTNVILGKENIILYGSGYIFDKLGNYKFKISPQSFYQINPSQTEILYNTAINSIIKDKENLKDKVALDLYCGIGTIGIFVAKYFKKIYGIEIVEQAIEDAKENAKINQIENIKFYSGDVEKILPELINTEKIKPDVVFVDPPRKGLDNKTIEILNKTKPEQVIYISCNPATMARDLKILEECYIIKEIQPVDMFPYTSHVECVAVMGIKDNL